MQGRRELRKKIDYFQMYRGGSMKRQITLGRFKEAKGSPITDCVDRNSYTSIFKTISVSQ